MASNLFLSMVEDLLRNGASDIENAGEQLKQRIGSTPQQARLIDDAVADLRRQEAGLITLLPVPTLSSRRQGRWYLGPRDGASPNWYSYRDHLLRRGWNESVVESIDEASTRITNELLCPNTETDDRFQGLVLGYVQSGKTASMAATIAKAADSGYRMVILLAGLTNTLRQQTQRRIETDIIYHNPNRWWVGTTEDQDFKLGKGIKLPTLEKGKCALLVVKKNAPVLRRLKRALGKLSEIERRFIPTLVIDDECDHASVNTAALRSDVSRINGLIRDICQKLPKVSYVGYTATPYANVLMAETSVDGSRDLYPSEFIVSLPEPENYFGARRLFGDDQGADRNDELPYIRRVPDEDMSSLQPQSRKNRDQFSPELTTSLRSACDYFLLALAARAHRGQASCHCCMLVHTTIYSVCHRRLRSLIKDTWLNPILRDLHAGNPERLDQLRSLWERESTALAHELREQLSCPNELESFELILPYLLSAAGSITITVENSDVHLAERLDFSSQTPIHTIVIGGNVLARGLTIEGLVISFFIRSSSQYDTLMQMGRWFGYRRGYEDLPRIWMTRELEYFFRDLVNVEELIRNEIVEITRRGWTPADMAVRVPQIASLSITARNKLVMENLEQCDLSFYGCHEQTIGFPVDDEFHRNNWEAGERLLMEAMANNGGRTETVGSSTLIRQVRAGPVRRFLHRYKAEAITIQKVAEFVDNELDAAETCMESWNLALVSAGDSHVISYGGVEKTGLLNRNKINPAYKIPSPHPDSITQELSSRIYLKALMGVSDMLVDVDGQQYKQWLKGLKDPGFSTEKNSWESVKRYRMEVLGQRPLLLLYPINRNSRPKRYNPSEPMDDFSRLPLLHGLPEGALTHHILGIGIVFPEVTRATAKHFLRVRLERPLEGEAFDDDEILRLQSAAEEEL